MKIWYEASSNTYNLSERHHAALNRGPVSLTPEEVKQLVDEYARREKERELTRQMLAQLDDMYAKAKAACESGRLRVWIDPGTSTVTLEGL